MKSFDHLFDSSYSLFLSIPCSNINIGGDSKALHMLPNFLQVNVDQLGNKAIRENRLKTVRLRKMLNDQ